MSGFILSKKGEINVIELWVTIENPSRKFPNITIAHYFLHFCALFTYQDRHGVHPV